jgi:hypothetical protein
MMGISLEVTELCVNCEVASLTAWMRQTPQPRRVYADFRRTGREPPSCFLLALATRARAATRWRSGPPSDGAPIGIAKCDCTPRGTIVVLKEATNPHYRSALTHMDNEDAQRSPAPFWDTDRDRNEAERADKSPGSVTMPKTVKTRNGNLSSPARVASKWKL